MIEEIGVSKHNAENNITRDYFSSRYNCYDIATVVSLESSNSSIRLKLNFVEIWKYGSN